MVIFFRTLILYSVVILVMRLMGKRQIGQLQPFELVVAIMISDLASIPMQNIGVPLITGLIPIFTLLIAQLSISFILLKSNKARKIICGSPCVLVRNGKIVEDKLRKEMFTLNDLIEAIRIAGYTDVSEVGTAILETNGTLSVFPKAKFKVPTAQELSLSVSEDKVPIDLIIDGKVLDKNLVKAGITKDNLFSAIHGFGANKFKDVLLCSMHDKNNFTVQLKEKINV